jgi:hypothetical protein
MFPPHLRGYLIVRSTVADHETRTVLAEPVGATTWMSVAHEVTSRVAVLDGLNLPVAVCLDLLTNVTHGRTEILNAVLVECFTGIDAPTAREMIDDLTLLAESVGVCHNDYLNLSKLLQPFNHPTRTGCGCCRLTGYIITGFKFDVKSI